jgi:hypothetical protein
MSESFFHESTACHCLRCTLSRQPLRSADPFPLGMMRMFCCDTCGNKRCPHSDDHRNACTGSNEPGQVGSRYGVPDAASGTLPNNQEQK